MATKDRNKKNTTEENPGKTKNEDELSDKGDLSGKATDKKTTPVEEEVESTPDTADTGMTREPGNNVIKEATPEELEEKSIDEEETESSSTTDCRCQKIDGEYYCFRLKQGRWIQWSVIPYPTKRICEAACCGD